MQCYSTNEVKVLDFSNISSIFFVTYLFSATMAIQYKVWLLKIVLVAHLSEY